MLYYKDMKTTQETKQLNSTENTEINGNKTDGRDDRGRFIEGNSGGPGRPHGSRDFITDFNEAVEEIAKLNNITISEARKVLLKRAYIEAKDGKFPFYKDIMDRYYGESSKQIDITSKGEKLSNIDVSELVSEFEDKLKEKLKNAE